MNVRDVKLLKEVSDRTSYRLTADLANSTLRNFASHVRLLKHNGKAIDRISLTTNTTDMLEGLVNKRGDPLTTGYKRQIGMSIRRMFPDVHIDLSKYEKLRKQSRATRKSSETFVETARKLTERCSNYICKVSKSNTIDDIGKYEAAIAALFTVATSLRIEEIRALKMDHLRQIELGEDLAIPVKRKRGNRFVAANDALLAVIASVRSLRDTVAKTIANSSTEKIMIKRKIRYDSGYIFVTSVSFMSSRLHELGADLKSGLIIKPATKASLGWNVFRDYISTYLIENNCTDLARMMNNHSSLNTTFENYTISSNRSLDRALREFDITEPYGGVSLAADATPPTTLL